MTKVRNEIIHFDSKGSALHLINASNSLLKILEKRLEVDQYAPKEDSNAKLIHYRTNMSIAKLKTALKMII